MAQPLRLTLTAFITALALLYFAPADSWSQPLLINEVLTSNGNWGVDEDGEYPDWIEILNTGSSPVDLEDFGLSDDPDRPFRWTFPSMSIEAGERLLVWASGKDRRGPTLHTSFSLSKDGEPVLLTAPDGALIDRIDVPELPRDVSFGRMPDGGSSWRYFTEPSPGAANEGQHYADILSPPTFSKPAGFHTGSFELTIDAEDGVTVYYTLDGSEPTTESPVYDGPLQITDREGDPNVFSQIRTTGAYHLWSPPMGEVFKGTVVRALALRDGALPSEVSTATYFIHPEGEHRYSLPVISIASNRDGLWGEREGLYVPGIVLDSLYQLRGRTSRADSVALEQQYSNYVMRGEDWERAVHLEMFDGGQTLLSRRAGLRIHGGLTRLQRQKSLRLYARSEYGSSDFEHFFFNEKPGVVSRRIILRAGGQDWMKTMFRDAFMQRLSRHMNLDYQAYEPAVVFINGEFWGIHNIRERIDQHYLAGNHGVDPGRLDLLTGSGSVDHGSNSAYLSFRSYVSQNDPRQADVYEYIASQMDIDNFIDYHVAQIFIRNNDWPHNNIDYWRAHPEAGADSRWRWIYYDTDFGFGWSADPWDRDMIAWARSPDGNGHGSWATVLFRRLLLNEEFRNQFINRLQDQLNTAYRTSHVIGLIDEFERMLEPEMGEHIHRWGWVKNPRPAHQEPANVSEWKANVEVLREFARRRPAYVRNHIRSNFNLRAPVYLTVNVSEPGSGHVEVNSIHVRDQTVGVGPDPYPWSRLYHGEIPVRLVPHAAPGYRFVQWSGTETSTKDTLYVTNSTVSTYVAQFVADEDWLDQAFPRPFDLSTDDYRMPDWPADAEAGTYPESMAFYHMDELDPTIDASPVAPTTGAYNLESRTRIVGLGEEGIAFINTGNEEGNPGYPGRRLGAAVLALDTRDRTDIVVNWTAGTVTPNVRKYALRLQYRLGDDGPLLDLLDAEGNPIEYVGGDEAGHSAAFGPILLPPDLEDKPYVQLWWRYYFTGRREEGDGGARDMLRLSDISVSSRTTVNADPPEARLTTRLLPAYPNPLSSRVTIPIELSDHTHASITIYDMLGRTVATVFEGPLPAGSHRLTWEPRDEASGVYLVRLRAGGVSQTHTITLIR